MTRKLLSTWLAAMLVLSLLSSCVGGRQNLLPATETPTPFRDQPTQTATGISPSFDQTSQIEVKDILPYSQSKGAQEADKAEQDLLTTLREQGGERQVLKDQADTVFRKLDAAEAELVSRMFTQVQSHTGKSTNRLFDLVYPRREINILYIPEETGLTYAGTVLGYLIISPDILSNLMKKGLGGNEIPPTEVNDTTAEGVTEHMIMRPAVNGSRMEVEVEVTLDFAGPPAANETIKGKISMDICPDADGNVPMELNFSMASTANGSGSQLTTYIQATGHVSDDGALSGFDVQSKSGVSTQKQGDEAPNQYVEIKVDYSLVGLEPGGNPKFNNYKGDFTRWSSQLSKEFIDKAQKAIKKFVETVPIMVFKIAEGKWTDGFCVEIQVPELKGDTNEVNPSSSTPFTTKVQHKFEDTELQAPVTANLSKGGEMVAPSGVKVAAPAAFTYKAPTEINLIATVVLETRSKRGVAKLELAFHTKAQLTELEFDSRFNFIEEDMGAGAITGTQHVHALVPLGWSEEDQAYKGEGPLTYLEFNVSPFMAVGGDDWYAPCPNKTSATGSTLRVLSLTGFSGEDSASGIQLIIDPGNTNEVATPICPPPFEDYTELEGYKTWDVAPKWSDHFLMIHILESHSLTPPFGPPFTILDWSTGGGDYLAKKVYQATHNESGVFIIEELTTLILR